MKPWWKAACALALTAAFAGCGGSGGNGAGGATEARTIAVTVAEDGFQPSAITVAKGEKVELVFTRTSEGTCAKKAVFEDGKTYGLPLDQEVRVRVPTDSAGTIAWACPMGMYRSTITVQ